jgi:hypothetical protein
VIKDVDIGIRTAGVKSLDTSTLRGIDFGDEKLAELSEDLV